MAESSDTPKKNKEVLDLLDETPKKLSRRERQRAESAKVTTVQDKKNAALDIFEDEGTKKKSTVIKKNRGMKKQMPTISKVIDKQNQVADELLVGKKPDATDLISSTRKASHPSDEQGDTPAESAQVDSSEVVKEGNVISIKPPVIVSELADLMELKPFQLMADLIKLEVFVAPHQAIEPDILVKGGDYKGKMVVGSDIAKEVKLIDFVEGKSTTAIVERMRGC